MEEELTKDYDSGQRISYLLTRGDYMTLMLSITSLFIVTVGI